MRIGVIGHKGMLGGAVRRAAEARGYEVWTFGLVYGAAPLGYTEPKVLINCAGIVKGRDNKSSYDIVESNSVLPHGYANEYPRVIHVSTDCVFYHDGPHSESSDPQPRDLYARSKLAGELHEAPHLTIRTSFVGFGLRGLLAELQAADEYRASALQLWTGHTVDTIADVLVTLAERPDITGLLHIPGETQSRYDLCVALKERYSLPVRIVRDDTHTADRRLVSERWADLSLPGLPPFAEQLERMVHP